MAAAAPVAVLVAQWEAAAAVVLLAAKAARVASWGSAEARGAVVVMSEAGRAAVAKVLKVTVMAAMTAAKTASAEMGAGAMRVAAGAAPVARGGGVRAVVCRCR